MNGEFTLIERRQWTETVMSRATCPAHAVIAAFYLREIGLYAPSRRHTFFEILALDSVYHSRLGMN